MTDSTEGTKWWNTKRWYASYDNPRSSTAGGHNDEENEDSPVTLSFLAVPKINNYE
jgi:hypothetical protein